MQPYQEATEESTRQSYRPFKVAGAIASSALPLAVSGMGGRVMSMLSQYVPENLAAKGLSKIDPRLGKFMSLGSEMGYSFDDLKGFLSQKVGQEAQQPAKENRNIIEQYSPELHKFMLEKIQGGINPMQAAALAQNDKRFSQIIDKLRKDHKANWSDIIQSIYGMGETAQPTQQMQQEPQQQQQPQVGQGQQALMAVLQRINQRLGQ